MSRHKLRPAIAYELRRSVRHNTLWFNAGLTTFTPSMAIRAGTVFAGAPIVQGKFDVSTTSDTLILARGNVVSGVWYDNFDPYQGSVVFWITPEWEGDDGLAHNVFDTRGAAGSPSIGKTTGNMLQFYSGGSGTITVDVSAWDAGTTYCVVISWDSKNTIDGTNYVRISINNVHTYDGTSSWAATEPRAFPTIGTVFTTASPANSVLEGLTIYRRVLFDGLYGKDVLGGIDEIEDIYAAGAGVDPCTITGSWDAVFGLPTDSTPAALVTGEGNAWSHPHDSEIELDAFLDELYAGGNWVDEGTPLTPVSLEFDGALTVVNYGSGANIDDMPDGGDGFTAEGWVLIDSGGEAGAGRILDKGNWLLAMDTGNINGAIMYAGATTNVTSAGTYDDKIPHHVAMTFESVANGGDGKARLWIDGVLDGTAAVATAGAYVADAAFDLFQGGEGAVPIRAFDGHMGWCRLSDSVRYTDTFVPNSRMNPPANDANAQLLCIMTDGAGLTVDDTSGNTYDGTITLGAGQWLNTHDMATDAPGARMYHGGYVFGCDAVNEGFNQTLAGLAAGSNYVFRVPVHYGADSRGQPEIIVYDETNGAAITTFLGPLMVGVHDGGDDSATFIDADGNFKQSQVGMTLYNITDGSSTTVTAVSGDGTTATGVLAGGTDDNWDDGDVGRFVWSDGFATHPWTETFCCELPTIARNGVGADCVSASLQDLNAADEGTRYSHQEEWLASALDNPGLETFTGANPDIPDGWTNVDLDAGDSVEENTIVHSGAASMEFAVGAAAEGISQQVTAAIGDFVNVGIWSYCDGSAGFTIGGLNATQLRAQYSATVFNVATPHTAVWSYTTAVFRVVAANPSIYILADAGAAGLRYIDDVVVTMTNAVSLTATPRTEANSVELGGLSIDGRDTCTQPSGRLTRTHGEIRFSANPRHDLDETGEWGQTWEYLADLYMDANNRLYLQRLNTPQIILSVESNGATLTDNYAAAWAAAVQQNFIVRWTPARVWVLINGVERLSVAWVSVFTADPATVYFGSNYVGARQFDGVILP